MQPTRLIKDALLHLPYPVLFHGYQSSYNLSLQLQSEATRRLVKLRSLTWEVLHERKQSDTLFVLGSGASINAITEARWEHIRQHDTFGINFWLIHEYVPTFYSIEAIDPSATPHSRRLLERHVQLAHEREDAYRAVPKLISDIIGPSRLEHLYRLPTSWREEGYRIPTTYCWARDTDELRYALKQLRRQGMFSPGAPLGHLFKYRATLSMIVSFAVKLGYRSIVLCGVDLSTPGYFYNDASRYPQYDEFRSSAPLPVHATLRPTKTSLPITDVLVTMRDCLLAPMGVELFVEHAGSALHPSLPVYHPELR